MKVANLIRKYGQKILLDSIDVMAYVDMDRSTIFNKRKRVDSFLSEFHLLNVLVDADVTNLDAKFEINGDEYFILEINDKPNKNGTVVYSDIVLWLNDLKEDIEIVSQELDKKGCNLPIVDNGNISTYKARIKTKNNKEILSYSLIGETPITHEFTIRYTTDKIEVKQLVKWDNRAFEIISIENVDERDKFLVLGCVEVLND